MLSCLHQRQDNKDKIFGQERIETRQEKTRQANTGEERRGEEREEKTRQDKPE